MMDKLKKNSKTLCIGKIIILCVFSSFFLYGAFHIKIFWILDLFNLMMHEG